MDLTVLPQLILTGIVLGAPLAAMGLGMSLILNVTHRFHFAFALTFTFAGMLAAELQAAFLLPGVLAAIAAVAAAAMLGVGIEVLVYRPLARRSGTGALLPIFVSALGLTIAGQSAVQLAWGGTAASLPFTLVDSAVLPLPLGLTTTTFDITALLLFGGIAFGAVVVLRRTRAGRIVRGVRGNPLMSRVVGIRPDSVHVWIFALVSAVAGLAACFSAARYSATSDMGYDPLFSAFVIAFLAGARAPALRVVLIGFALGIVQSISTIWIPSNLTDIVVFGLLFVYLVLKGTDTLRLLTPRLQRI